MGLYAKITGGQALREFWKLSPRELLTWASIKAGRDDMDLDIAAGVEEMI